MSHSPLSYFLQLRIHGDDLDGHGHLQHQQCHIGYYKLMAKVELHFTCVETVTDICYSHLPIYRFDLLVDEELYLSCTSYPVVTRLYTACRRLTAVRI